MAKRRTRARTDRSTGELQKMGGKEERVSQVGKARRRAEEQEARGEARFDLAPGPDTDELLRGPKGAPKARPGRKVSRRPRAEPGRLEPEEKATTRRSGSPESKVERQPKDQTPRDPGEPPAEGEVPG